MKNKLLKALSLSLIVACSFVLLPACDWFGQDKMEVVVDGDTDPNTPTAQYSSFLTAVHTSQNYAGSYKYTLTNTELSNEFDVSASNLSRKNTSSETDEEILNIYVDAKNHCVLEVDKYRLINNKEDAANKSFNLDYALLMKNIKESDSESAADYYIERKITRNLFLGGKYKNFKTQKDRVAHYTLNSITELANLPDFDKINISRNAKLLGSTDFSLIKNLETDYLNAENIKVKAFMPQRESTLQIELSASYQTSDTYKYTYFATTITFTCDKGKLTNIHQTRAIKKASEEKYFNAEHYEKENIKTSDITIEYLDEWDTTSEEYRSIFVTPNYSIGATKLIDASVISTLRTDKDSLSGTTNKLNININGIKEHSYELKEGTFKEMSSIISDYGKQSAYIMQEDKSLVPTQIDIKFYSDAEYKNEIDIASARTAMPYDTTIYGKYVLTHSKQSIVIVREHIQEYPNLPYYYKTSTGKKSVLGDHVINTPIICTMEDGNYEFDHTARDISYSAQYVVTTYINNDPNSSNMSLGYKKGAVQYLDYYLVKKVTM